MSAGLRRYICKGRRRRDVGVSYQEELSPGGFELPFTLEEVVVSQPPDVIRPSAFPPASRSRSHQLSSCKLCFATALILDLENSRVNWMSFRLVRCPVKTEVNGNVLDHQKLSTVQLSPQNPGLTRLSWGWREKPEGWSLSDIILLAELSAHFPLIALPGSWLPLR